MHTVTDAAIFQQEVLKGLSQIPKTLPSKYFYDGAGDVLFQQIMACPEYYLTRAEAEILKEQAGAIAGLLHTGEGIPEIVELGAGDASKTVYLLRELVAQKGSCNYLPIDISSGMITDLEDRLPNVVSGITVQGFNGEYLPMLHEVYKTYVGRQKAVLFMGGNIGNMHPEEAVRFCADLREIMAAGDLLLIGFDLVKSPRKILAAYNDAGGLTRDFNLNLLRRINTDLEANFNLEQFYHYPTYDPQTGACKSYIVSDCRQEVTFGKSAEIIIFEEGETIYTEISQKYRLDQISYIAKKAGFSPAGDFFDSKQQFVVSVWRG